MIARLLLCLGLCAALAACSDPQKSIQGTVGYSRLDDCRFVLEPGGNSDGFQPFEVIKNTPDCLKAVVGISRVVPKDDDLSGKPAGHGMSYPEREPPRKHTS